jgi:hypothetical protein
MSDMLSMDIQREIVQETLKQFPKQTPGVYRWTVAALAFIVFAVVAATITRPESAGYIMCTVVFMILLIFVLFSIEKSQEQANRQFALLSWFSVVALIGGATSIITSLLFGWPLMISLSEDYTSPRFLKHVHEYDMYDSVFSKNQDTQWSEVFQGNNQRRYDFEQRGLSSDYLLLYDPTRKISIRIPAHGGILQWTTSETYEECRNKPCWGDVGRATPVGE